MKKILSIMLVAGLFALTACGGEEEKEEDKEEEAKENVEKAPETTAETTTEETTEEQPKGAAHVCDDKCAEACTGPRCGEEGHTCSEACHAEHNEGDHEHTGEDDGHDHEAHDASSEG